MALFSEEVSLLHDAHELLFGDLAVTVAICLIYHLLDLLIGHGLAEFFSNSLKVLEGNLA